MVRRIASASLAIMMMISGNVSYAADTTADEENIIKLEYQEYIDNQDYYSHLAKDGYTLFIHVGAENAKQEQDRIDANCNGTADNLVQSNLQTRELTIPTYRYNVLENGKKVISGATTTPLGYLFTNYIYYGCTAFELSLYNQGDDTLEVDLVKEGSTTAFLSYEIPPETTVIEYVTEDYWYGRFKNPCNVYGYVKRDV